MRQLSLSTAQSAEDITEYVKQLDKESRLLAFSIDETANNLHDGNEKVEEALADMEQMNSQIKLINERVDSIFEAIDIQTNTTAELSGRIESLSDSYDALSGNCIGLGRHIFKIGRYVDKTRSDMVRKNSVITELDWIRVFEVDHFVLVWRVYNNIVGFERLKESQVNNPEGCKLGKWLLAQKKPELTGSSEFQRLAAAHNVLHDMATHSWQAKEAGDDRTAMSYFEKAYQAFVVFDEAIQRMMEKMRTLGYREVTEIVPFQKTERK